MQRKRVFVTSQYLITDPPTKNVVDNLFCSGYEVVYVEQSLKIKTELLPQGIVSINIRLFNLLPFHFLGRLVNSFFYKWKINQLIRKYKPDVVIGIMFQPISAIRITSGALFIAAILDIPVIDNCGKYDKIIFNKAFKRLPNWHLVWASDEYKARLIKEICKLSNGPTICYNCPPLNYFDGYDKTQCRKWILNKLKLSGAIINKDAVIILRAGAIGDYGGLEETLAVFKSLPHNSYFILIGRPGVQYAIKINYLITYYSLTKQVFLFQQPTDDEWKKYLFGADIGHLVHIKPIDNFQAAAIYNLNSSLSNNRLYQYMAAGLPIIGYNDPRLNIIFNVVDCFRIVDVAKLKESIMALCIELVNNPTLRENLGRNGKDAFLNKYNWEIQFKSILGKIK